MGVQGLWSILESTGQPIPAHSLKGKVLAIDVSIWLHQAVKGYRDKDGNPVPNAHLIGVFHRICKLLSYGVRPVFVFDGGVPALKRETMAIRKQRKLGAQDKSDAARTKLLSNYLMEQIQMKTKQALPPSLRLAGLSPMKKGESSISRSPKGKGRDRNEVDSDLEELRQKLESVEYDNLDAPAYGIMVSSDEGEESSDSEDYEPRNYSEHFSVIKSPDFDALPLESQHEILHQMQESRKANSWNRMHEMPRDPNDFSSFQMDLLVKRNFLQKKIKSVQKEMGQQHIHVQNLDDLAEYEKEFGTSSQETKIIGSKEKGALLLKPNSNSQPIAGPSRKQEKPEVITLDDYVESWSSDDDIVEVKKESKPDLAEAEAPKITEEEADIARAIQLSLEENQNQGPSLSRSSNEQEPVTEEQKGGTVRKKSLSESPTKGRKTADSSHALHKGFQQAEDMFSPMYKFLGWVGFSDKAVTSPVKSKEPVAISASPEKFKESLPTRSPSPVKSMNPSPVASVSPVKSKQPVSVAPSMATVPEECSSSSDDDDFEDVEETVNGSAAIPQITLPVRQPATEGSSIPIVFSLNKISHENDIFADIFDPKPNDPVILDEDDLDIKGVAHPSNGIGNGDLNNHFSISSTKVRPESELQVSSIESEVETPNLVAERSEATEIVNSQNQTTGEKETETETVESQSQPETQPFQQASVEEMEWDSDPEVTSDLEDMLSQETQPAEPSDPSEPRPETPGLSTRNQQITRTLGVMPSGHDQDKPPEVRMITADFLQAQQKLSTEKGLLRSEKGAQERLAATITDQMYIEAQELLSLFGIPFVVSPMEAESQCAVLDIACLTDGTITDDSDIWLFGGRRVYRNVFSSGDKHVEFYHNASILEKLNLCREKFVLLALLTGSDYTNGVEGAGPVTALEVISEFASDTAEPFDGLVKFREWWEFSQITKDIIEAENKVREKLRKLKLPPGFPNRIVYDAYMNPSVDSSMEPFRWGTPDLDSIRQYSNNKFGWDHQKCDTVLKPVLKNFECQVKEISRQMTLDRFVTIGKSSPSLFPGKRKKISTRLAKAMKKLKRGVGTAPQELNLSSDESNSNPSDSDNKKKAKAKPPPKSEITKKKQRRRQALSSDTDEDQDAEFEILLKKPTRGKNSSQELKAQIEAASVRIPKKTEDIPVLQKSMEASERESNKRKAIEIFKKNGK